MISFLNSVENIVGKQGNAGYYQFLLFPQCFQNLMNKVGNKERN